MVLMMQAGTSVASFNYRVLNITALTREVTREFTGISFASSGTNLLLPSSNFHEGIQWVTHYQMYIASLSSVVAEF